MTLLACFLMVAGMVTAQNQKVTGVVTSAVDGEPVIGASVAVKGISTLGAVTDLDGKFEISGVPSTAKTLVISYVGMVTKEVAIKPNVKVILEEDSEALEEVIVQAFGTAKKSAFTGSAAVVNADKISESQVSSVTNALAGKVAGVQMASSNGAPGATSSIRIRGFSSINAGQSPLIVVDGAPYDGDIANINSADVESMTVLKDAASNALYGARGANGVIMITTKKAKQGDAQITFDAKYGSNTRAMQQYNVITDPAMYYETHYKALTNYYMTNEKKDANQAWQTANANLFSEQGNGGLGYNVYTIPEGQFLIGQNGKLNPNATLGRKYSVDGQEFYVAPDNWEDYGYRIGNRQEYNFSASAANDKSNFFASLGYLKNEGITANSDFNRLSGRLRADYQAKKWMKVGANMSFAKFSGNDLSDNGNSTSTGNIWAFVSQVAPIYPLFVRNGDGSIYTDANGIQVMDYGNGDLSRGGFPGLNRPFLQDANALQQVLLNKNHHEGNAASGSGFADITFFPGLVLTLNGTYNLDETRFNLLYNPYYGQFRTTGGTVEVEHTRTYTYNLQQLLNYTTTIGKYNNLNVMAGHEYYNNMYYALWGTKHQMFTPDDDELNRAVVDNSGSGSYKRQYNNEGYFGRVQYDYDGRIFASASLRRDASSRFAPENRWGTFWSAGAAWLINKEAWFGADWVDELKLKASVGSQGNDNIGEWRYTDLYDISNSDGNVGVSFASKGSRNITWETNTNFNAGVEFGLFGRLSGGIEYFYRKTTDMLFSFSVAPSAGYTSYYDNVGDLYNKGFELELNYNIVNQKNIKWDVFANATTLKNRITMLDSEKKVNHYYDKDLNRYDGYASGSFFVSEGESMYSWRLREFAGVAEDDGQSLWYYNRPEYDGWEWQAVADSKDPYAYENVSKEKDADGKPVGGTYYKTYEGVGDYVEDFEGNKFAVDSEGNKISTDKDGNALTSSNGAKFQTGHTLQKTKTYSQASYYVNHKTTIPDVYGGFGTSIQAYGFDFSVNFSYQLGGYSYDNTYANFMGTPLSSHTGENIHVDALKAWTKDSPSKTIPRWQFDDTYSNGSSTRFLTKSSYLNIENIALGYTFPARWTRQALINSLRVYVTADNLWYWSARQGLDPRQTYTGDGNATNYQPMRSMSAGVTLKF